LYVESLKCFKSNLPNDQENRINISVKNTNTEVLQYLTTKEITGLPSSVYVSISPVLTDLEPDILAVSERQEFSRLNTNNRRAEFLTSRYLLREMSGQLDIGSPSLRLKKSELGKPYGEYETDIVNVSIAHTQNRVLCAMSADREVGIDIEPVGRTVNKRIRNRLLNTIELESHEAVPTIQLWTMKEAVVKLYGTGIRRNLHEIHLEKIDKNRYQAACNDEWPVTICTSEIEDYWIAVATYDVKE